MAYNFASLDFETDESMKAQKFNPRYYPGYSLPDRTVRMRIYQSYCGIFTEGLFSIAATAYLPASFSFPLGKYYGVSLVIDRQALSEKYAGSCRQFHQP